mmetsp:Transcript_48052/g.97803  ORF Transcript_48052/g.97803 Transcript_48052/m.97803 type:complete len:225 (+) Transcript_48052:5419-6093(+)
MYHLAQSFTLPTASGNDRKLKKVLTQICRLVGELQLEGVVGLNGNFVDLRIGLLILVLILCADLRGILGRSYQGSLGTAHGGRGRRLSFCDTTDGQLILLQRNWLQCRGVVIGIIDRIGSLLQKRKTKLGVWLQVDVVSPFHRRGILQGDGHNPLCSKGQLTKLNFILHEFDVGIHSRGHDRQANGFASSDVESDGGLKLHRPVQQHVHIDFSSTLWGHSPTHG